MSKRLTLICHGATAATRAAAFPQDEPLEDGVLSRVEVLGQGLRRPDRAWSSPALRARQTAAALALDASVNGSLRDCDYGRWGGRTFTDVQTHEPASVAAWLSDAEAAPHGGELLSDLFGASGMDGRVHPRRGPPYDRGDTCGSDFQRRFSMFSTRRPGLSGGSISSL